MRAHSLFCALMVIFHQLLGNHCKSLIPPFLLTEGNRIVGGEPAVLGQFPYQLSMQWGGYHFCGATLLDSTVALTAAHCIEAIGNDLRYLTVMGGSHKISGNIGTKQTVGVRKAVVHEKYMGFDNDIGILILSSPFSLNTNLKPAALPEQDEVYRGNLTVSGWGLTCEDCPGTEDTLRFVTVPTVDNDKCSEAYGGRITSSMMCAGYYDEGGKDSCQGDSGGPAVSSVSGTEEEKFVLQGIVSWGRGCAQPKYPGVYTRVSSYINWIKQNI